MSEEEKKRNLDCWYACSTFGEDLSWCAEFDTWVHRSCVKDILAVDPECEETLIIAWDIGLMPWGTPYGKNGVQIEVHEVVETDFIGEGEDLVPEMRMLSMIIEVPDFRGFDDYDTAHWLNRPVEYVVGLGFVLEDLNFEDWK